MSEEKFALPPREWVEAEAKRRGVPAGAVLDELMKAHKLRSRAALKQISDEGLKGIAAQAFNLAKGDIERRRFNFLIASYHVDDVPPLHRMTMVEATVVEKLGENWLNSGDTKDAGFFVLRLACDLQPPDAIVIATIANWFKPSAKFDALPQETQHELLNASHRNHHQAVAEGLMTVCDALNVVVQTPARVCIYIQRMTRRGAVDGAPQIQFWDQADFGGRMKMFGEEVE